MTFVIAGFVKGTVGLGLPIVAITFMALPLGLKEAIAVTLVPAVTTNIWQAFAGPYLRNLTSRLWSYLALCAVGTWIGVAILALASQQTLLSALGVILATYSLFSLTRPQISPPGRREFYLSPLSGGIGGMMYGMTGVFMIPGVIYLQALGLRKDELVQALGLAFIVLNLSLAFAFMEKGFISRDITILSIAALIPAAAGVYVGQKLRKHISEALFRTLFFSALLAAGIYFVTSAQL